MRMAKYSAIPVVASDKRILISLLATLIIAVAFWSSSRYPSLNEKAIMAGELQLEDPLGFEAAFPISPDDPTITRIAFTTANWVSTNLEGMTFGVLFAAVFMTLLSSLRQIQFRSAWANTLLGTVLGAPLGVCVNCAAPIARGMHSAGAQLETTLATMISSPTLNVVVLGVLFSIFPFHIAAMKVAVTLLFILVVIPLLCRFVFYRERAKQIPFERTYVAPLGEPEMPLAETAFDWRTALIWFVKNYPANLWRIVRMTVPLMFLAGLLGAATVTLLPWETLVEQLDDLSWKRELVAIAGLACLGLFLPVPIAFDVFICAALLSAGMSVTHVTILLFTLGIFSVYSFLIVGGAVSWRVATGVSIVLLGLGVGTGVAAGYVDEVIKERKIQTFLQAFGEADPSPRPRPEAPPSIDEETLTAQLASHALRYTPFAVQGPENVDVVSLRHRGQPDGGGALFEKRDGPDYGLQAVGPNWLVHKYILPHAQLGAIAAGDVHGDGWPDILLGSSRGVLLYANIGGERFALQQIDIPALSDSYVGAIALVDLNNDGWLDIFLSTFRKGHYVIYSEQGRFLAENTHALPMDAANLANAAAFADLDGDGTLEGVLGNYMAGHTYLFLEEARNMLFRHGPDGFVTEPLPGMPGETLSTLFSDINRDGHIDLLVGNDFQIPDTIYLGNTQGELRRSLREDGLFPHTTYSTMSIDSADIDNDLDLEIYFGQITGSMFADHERLDIRRYEEVCESIGSSERAGRCHANMELHKIVNNRRSEKDLSEMFGCNAIVDGNSRLDCVAVELFRWSRRYHDPRHCAIFPEAWAELAFMCNYLMRRDERFKRQDRDAQIRQEGRRNQLFFRTPGGAFVDRAQELGVDIAGWTWNAKFADVDNDEWQDLYVVNGWYGSRRRESNQFFRNVEGQRFVEQTHMAGLDDYLATGAYTYVDFDNDGDLDIVSVPFQSDPWIYRNQTQNRNSIAVELRDHVGNRFGIGSTIVVHYGQADERHQIREIKAGGGYLSFDAPIAHFGLGSHGNVSRIEVTWSTGERSVLEGDFRSGARYRITRRPPG